MGRTVGYAIVGNGRNPSDRQRLEAAFDAAGIIPLEIVEEDLLEPSHRGRYGIGRLRELATRSDVDTVVVADSDSFGDSFLVQFLGKKLASDGVKFMALAGGETHATFVDLPTGREA